MKLNAQHVTEFQEVVWDYFRKNERPMPWRQRPTPYHVLVSELMLQQTQVPRVIPKFEAFIQRFPDVESLASATLAQVLSLWSGLGYNRRAKFLHDAAKMVSTGFGGDIPSTREELVKLPGVGPNTAGAILAYAYNQPVVFIETNIRTVFIHHFFHDQFDVSDGDILDLARQTLPAIREEQPERRIYSAHGAMRNGMYTICEAKSYKPIYHYREWYWALMDYGTHVKQIAGGRLAQSKHYKKQSPLAGSVREMRGRIVRALRGGMLDEMSLRTVVNADDRFAVALEALRAEGMIAGQNGTWCLTGDGDTR